MQKFDFVVSIMCWLSVSPKTHILKKRNERKDTQTKRTYTYAYTIISYPAIPGINSFKLNCNCPELIKHIQQHMHTTMTTKDQSVVFVLSFCFSILSFRFSFYCVRSPYLFVFCFVFLFFSIWCFFCVLYSVTLFELIIVILVISHFYVFLFFVLFCW